MRDDDWMDARFLGITELVEAPSVAVVVDVMRAFTVASWAFARGADKIVLAGSLDEALALKARHPDWLALKDEGLAHGAPYVRRARFDRRGCELTSPHLTSVQSKSQSQPQPQLQSVVRRGGKGVEQGRHHGTVPDGEAAGL